MLKRDAEARHRQESPGAKRAIDFEGIRLAELTPTCRVTHLQRRQLCDALMARRGVHVWRREVDAEEAVLRSVMPAFCIAKVSENETECDLITSSPGCWDHMARYCDANLTAEVRPW